MAVLAYLNRKHLQSVFKPIYFIPILIFLFAAFLSFNFTQKNIREKVVELDYFEEGRFIEFIAIYNEIFVHGDISNYFAGHKDSYLARFDDNLSTNEYITSERTLHSDLAIILFSSGLLGLLFYLNIIFSTFKKQLSLSNYLKSDSYSSAFWALFIGLCLNLFADSHTVSTARIIPYMLIGFTLGYQKRLLVLSIKPLVK